MKFYINGFSAICTDGIFTKDIVQPLERGSSPLDINRKMVYSKLHTGFGKLNPPDKLAFSAASLILDKLENINSEKTGISIGSTIGSLSTDIRYIESVKEKFPRPAYFQATLPSSALAEVAIIFKLKGPDRSNTKLTGSGIEAFSSALKILELDKSESMLVIFVNGIDPLDKNSEFIPVENQNEPFGFAFLISKKSMQDSNTPLFSNIKYGKNKNLSNSCEKSYFLDIVKKLKNKNSIHSKITLNGLTFEIKTEG